MATYSVDSEDDDGDEDEGDEDGDGDEGDDEDATNLLEDVSALIVVDHSEEELVGEGRRVAPRVSQDLVLLIGLPAGDQ